MPSFAHLTGSSFSKNNTTDLPPSLKFMGLNYGDVLDSFPEGVFLVNTRWQIGYFNQTAEEITGYNQDEVLGKFCWDIFQSDLCHKNCPMRVSMSTGEILLDRELEIITRDGSKKLILSSTAQIKKAGRKVLGGIETFHELVCPEADSERIESSIFGNIVGVSSRMQEIIHDLPIIAASDSNVLIQGESGTGKELVARALHLHSPRKQGPFVAVNCSAIPETLLESELFGHERGAFTGAVATKLGRFELAKGGTLFLDEIGDLKPALQVKLLRVLEGKGFMRVGGTRKVPLEARIIAATNVNLREAMRQGEFRDDLYYRLFTVPIYLPPLRKKREDIPILVKHFLEKLNRKFQNRNIKDVDPKVMKIFCRHPWPGNVRELEHVLEYCFVFAKGHIITERYLPKMDSAWSQKVLEWTDDTITPLEAVEKETIIRVLQQAGGRKEEAARLLKISRSKLWRKIKLYDIKDEDFKTEM